MIDIDGTRGEGGGQILRTALALSLVTGEAFRMRGIRAGRARPGLLRQHLTCVEAAAAVSSASVEGASPGSLELVFRPGSPKAGAYRFDIGSAGSTTLVAQTVLPALWSLAEPSTVVITGGTHNPLAPPADFLAHAFAPQLARIGLHLAVHLDRPGFYPAGGGVLRVETGPAGASSSLSLLERGPSLDRRITSLVANLRGDIGRRQIALACAELGWDDSEASIVARRDAVSSGNALSATLRYEHVTEVATSFGERGRRSEDVVQELAAGVRAYLAHDAPVGEHLCDQLLLPLALREGGEFRAAAPSLHATTQAETMARFLGPRVTFTAEPAGTVRVAVRG